MSVDLGIKQPSTSAERTWGRVTIDYRCPTQKLGARVGKVSGGDAPEREPAGKTFLRLTRSCGYGDTAQKRSSGVKNGQFGGAAVLP